VRIDLPVSYRELADVIEHLLSEIPADARVTTDSEWNDEEKVFEQCLLVEWEVAS